MQRNKGGEKMNDEIRIGLQILAVLFLSGSILYWSIKVYNNTKGE